MLKTMANKENRKFQIVTAVMWHFLGDHHQYFITDHDKHYIQL